MTEDERDYYDEKSFDSALCRKLFLEAMLYFDKRDVELEEHQEKSLWNHIAEMVKRNFLHEQLNVGDTSIFNDVSSASIQKSKDIVQQLPHISKDEVYLLAIHFESAHY